MSLRLRCHRMRARHAPVSLTTRPPNARLQLCLSNVFGMLCAFSPPLHRFDPYRPLRAAPRAEERFAFGAAQPLALRSAPRAPPHLRSVRDLRDRLHNEAAVAARRSDKCAGAAAPRGQRWRSSGNI